MKKKIIAFFILAFISINAQQEDWTYITTLQETDYYYKLNSYNTAWTKEISKKQNIIQQEVKLQELLMDIK